ncbi:MAG: ATP-sensitive inward rectifier potassium channel 10 [Oscillatoriales cyanobacterium SM2_1_8]|nr:ATP-sensitive inward rectifier potassium channel 10 [Oscillatoriales cyanobacterium SM2_1_8]
MVLRRRWQKKIRRDPFQEAVVRVARVGVRSWRWNDLYHGLLTQTWSAFLMSLAAVYLALNALFALLYWPALGGITNAQPGRFADAFFFSVQTFGTIGYGALAPASDYVNAVVTVESLVAILANAAATGLTFARLARPRTQAVFSKLAVICQEGDRPVLVFRVANERDSYLLQAEFGAVLRQTETDPDGSLHRREYVLSLDNDRCWFFDHAWEVRHPIAPDSPLWQATETLLDERQVEIVVVAGGVDAYTAQTAYITHRYYSTNILWDMSFVDVIERQPDGSYAVNFQNLHKLRPHLPQD